MSPAKVIHIGADISNRILLLEAAGCRVKECQSLAEAVKALQSEGADVVVLTASEEWDEQRLLRTVRQYTSAPLILFENTQSGTGRQGFDLVIEPQTPPQNWLQRISSFFEGGRTVRIARPQGAGADQAPAPDDQAPIGTASGDAGSSRGRSWRSASAR